MQIDITFHYPADLMALLIDAIPALNKSKMDVILSSKGPASALATSLISNDGSAPTATASGSTRSCATS
jgi:hypothetical protein